MTYNNALKSCSHAFVHLHIHIHIQVVSNYLHQKKEEIKGRNMTRMIRSQRIAHLVARYVNTQETSAKTLTFSVENER